MPPHALGLMENNVNTLGPLPGAALGPWASGPWAAPGRGPWVWHFFHDPSGRGGILSHNPSGWDVIFLPQIGFIHILH